MSKILICSVVIGIFSFFSLFSQNVELVQVVKQAKCSSIDWTISNAEGEIIVLSNEFTQTDTANVSLIANASYTLQVSVNSVCKSDTVLISLNISDSPILLMFSDVEVGDHEFSFYAGMKKPQLRIVGGANADISDFPWQACFLPGEYLCGGAIISEKWIITAAHCTFDSDGNSIDVSNMNVVVGTSTPFYFSSGQKIKIKNFYIHDDYDIDGTLYDIALLELEDSINIENATPIDLISSEDIVTGALDPGVLGWVTGWGKTRTRSSSVSSTLQKVQLPIVTNDVASSVWGKIDDSFLMAGYKSGNKDACGGDSGGPFVVETDGGYRLAGVVSWGSTDCDSYGGYTRIFNYESWIRQVSGVKSRSYLDMPTGDEVVCEGVKTSVYYTDLRNGASDYQWKLSPDSAGDISYNSNTAVVEWDETFKGQVDLEVRAVVNSDTLNWATKSIHISDYTSVSSQSADPILCAGQDLEITVEAEGYDLDYSWYKDENDLKADSSVLLVAGATADDSGVYYCKIAGACGDVVSEEILATIYSNTAIANHPIDTSVETADDVVLNVNATGEDLRYRWYRYSTVIAGEENPTLVLNEVDANAIGLYRVEVTGVCGDPLVSDSAFVYVKGINKGVVSSINIRSSLIGHTVNVAVDTAIPYDLELFDISGKRVLMKTDCLYEASISLAHLPKGVFLLKVSNPILNGSCKIIKED